MRRHGLMTGLAGMFLAAALALAGCGSSGGGPPPTPATASVGMLGGWADPIQKVGTPADIQLRVNNVGDPLPHYVLVIDGFQFLWKDVSAQGCGRKAKRLPVYQGDDVWDFGPLKKSQQCDLTIHTIPEAPTGARGHILIRAYWGLDSKGHVLGPTRVSGGSEFNATVTRP